jgi:hypothetical protein
MDDLPAVVDHLRAVLGNAAFDRCGAAGADLNMAEAVGYARHHIEVARQEAAEPDSRGT